MRKKNNMNKFKQFLTKTPSILGVVCGGVLVSLPMLADSASAQMNQMGRRMMGQATNPCPGIYYEEPFNNRSIVPEGCRPNAATQRRGQMNARFQPVVPPTGAANTPAVRRVIPSPEMRSNAIGRVMPMNGRVDVVLKNDTNATITYEAIEHTQRRYLPGGREVTLRNLPVSATITTVREDNGFLRVIPMQTQNGQVVFSLEEEPSFIDSNQGVIRIQEDGQIFLN